MIRLIIVFSFLALSSFGSAFAASIPPLGSPTDGIPSQSVRTVFGFTWPATGSARTRVIYRETGIDLLAAAGDRILAVEAGIVKEAVATVPLMLGSIGYIIIEHTDGYGAKYTSYYYHTYNTQPQVTVGSAVTKGQYLADVCDLGLNTHLHFGIRNAPYDPSQAKRDYLPIAASSTTPKFPEMYVDPLLYIP